MKRLFITSAFAVGMFFAVSGNALSYSNVDTNADLEAIDMPEVVLTPDIQPVKPVITKATAEDIAELAGAPTIHAAPAITPSAKDYSLSITIPTCYYNNSLPLSFTAGSDIKTLRYLFYEGDYSNTTANMQYVAKYGDEIERDDETDNFEAMRIALTTERNSRFTLFVCGLDKSGNYQAGCWTYFYCINEDNSQWTTIGNSSFRDDMLASIFSSIYVSTNTVTIQENVNTPGYYRLVNPYGSGYYYYSKSKYSHYHKHYIYIHAEDPDKVYIEESPVCFDMGYGGISVASLAIPGWPAVSGETTASHYGKMTRTSPTSATITFPQKSLVVAMQNYNEGKWWRANTNGLTSITVPITPDPSAQTITWDQTIPTLYIGSTIELSATATSGLPVQFSLAAGSEGIASLEGNVLTALAPGTVTVIASQPGDGGYDWTAAPEERRQIVISRYYATDLYVTGAFCNWEIDDEYKLTTADNILYTVTLPTGALYDDGTPVEWDVRTALGDVTFGRGDIVEAGGTQVYCGGGHNISDIQGQVTVMMFLNRDCWVDGATVDMTLQVEEVRPPHVPETLYVFGAIEEGEFDIDHMAPLVKTDNLFQGVVTFTGDSFILCEHPATEEGDWMTIGTIYGPNAETSMLLATDYPVVVDAVDYAYTIGAPGLVYPVKLSVVVNFDENTIQLRTYKDVSGAEMLIESDADSCAYYNMQGIRVANPRQGALYIRVNSDGSAAKTIFK